MEIVEIKNIVCEIQKYVFDRINIVDSILVKFQVSEVKNIMIEIMRLVYGEKKNDLQDIVKQLNIYVI